MVAVRNILSSFGFSTITNEFFELDVGDLVWRHTGVEIVSFTITFDGDTGTFSESITKTWNIWNKKEGIF